MHQGIQTKVKKPNVLSKDRNIRGMKGAGTIMVNEEPGQLRQNGTCRWIQEPLYHNKMISWTKMVLYIKRFEFLYMIQIASSVPYLSTIPIKIEKRFVCNGLANNIPYRFGKKEVDDSLAWYGASAM